MIESVDNIVQLLFTGLCTVICLYYAVRYRNRAWILCALFSGAFFLGDLYWFLHLVFYQATPLHSYIPDLSWYSSLLFLTLLLHLVGGGKTLPNHVLANRKILWLVPLFTVSMCAFFMQWGEYLSNAIYAVLMTGVLLYAIDGLMACRGTSMRDGGMKLLYVITALFCLAEYALWVSSCFWTGDALTNPYYLFDFLISFMFLLYPAALRKVARR